MSMGRPEEAIAVTREAHRIDPLSPVSGSSFAMILYLARDYGQALEIVERTREMHPEHFLPYLRMGLILMQQGAHQRAVFRIENSGRAIQRKHGDNGGSWCGFRVGGKNQAGEGIALAAREIAGTALRAALQHCENPCVRRQQNEGVRMAGKSV